MRADVAAALAVDRMPLPRVTKPTIGSGVRVAAAREPVMSRSTPTMRIPLPAPAALLFALDDGNLLSDRQAPIGPAHRVDRVLAARAD